MKFIIKKQKLDISKMATFGVMAVFNDVENEVKAQNQGETPKKEDHSDLKLIPEGRVEYTVQKGDTFGKIAKDNNETIQSLQEKNPGVKNINKIYPGQKLLINKGKTVRMPDDKWQQLNDERKKHYWIQNEDFLLNDKEGLSELQAEYYRNQHDNFRFKPDQWTFRSKNNQYPEVTEVLHDMTGNDYRLQNVITTDTGNWIADGNVQNYVVQRGDNLARIAKRNGSDLYHLKKLNGFDVNDSKSGGNLREGQVIKFQRLKRQPVANWNGVDPLAVMEFESYRPDARLAPGERNYNYGFGTTNSSVKAGTRTNLYEAKDFFNKDIEKVKNTINNWLINKNLTPYQMQVLLDYGYNSGMGNMVNVIKMVNEGKMNDAIKQMSTYKNQSAKRGLDNRVRWRNYMWRRR